MNVLGIMALDAGIAPCAERLLSISIGTVSFRRTVAMPRVSRQRRTAGCIWPTRRVGYPFPAPRALPRHW
jgi:hypothetical protein